MPFKLYDRGPKIKTKVSLATNNPMPRCAAIASTVMMPDDLVHPTVIANASGCQVSREDLAISTHVSGSLAAQPTVVASAMQARSGRYKVSARLMTRLSTTWPGPYTCPNSMSLTTACSVGKAITLTADCNAS